MKTDLRCVPCFYKQGVSVISKLGIKDEFVYRKVFKDISDLVFSYLDFSKPPAWNGTYVYRAIELALGIKDPYKEIKKEDNAKAKRIIEKYLFENKLSSFEDYVKFAVAGNVIDYGTGEPPKEVIGKIYEIVNTSPAVNDLEELREDLHKANSLLYLFDNSGEIMFDLVFLKAIKSFYPNIKKIYLGVKEYPLINDISKYDIDGLPLDDIGTVISNGSNYIGNVLDTLSDEFLKVMRGVDIIISKGQANFECLNDYNENIIYFLMVIKCEVVAEYLGIKKGKYIIKKGG
jgi:uncharacterized protein with ATP-grasp and redox domains